MIITVKKQTYPIMVLQGGPLDGERVSSAHVSPHSSTLLIAHDVHTTPPRVEMHEYQRTGIRTARWVRLAEVRVRGRDETVESSVVARRELPRSDPAEMGIIVCEGPMFAGPAGDPAVFAILNSLDEMEIPRLALRFDGNDLLLSRPQGGVVRASFEGGRVALARGRFAHYFSLRKWYGGAVEKAQGGNPSLLIVLWEGSTRLVAPPQIARQLLKKLVVGQNDVKYDQLAPTLPPMR